MVRWRICLLLGLLLVLPIKPEQDDDEDSNDDNDDNDGDNNDDDDPPEKSERQTGMWRLTSPTTTVEVVTRTTQRKPLECYVCAFKADRPLRSCLDPAKFRVHTMTCQNPEEKCFTSFTFKPLTASYEAVMRGCRAGCSTSPETSCCESSRCNNQALASPTSHNLVSVENPLTAKATTSLPPSVLFFVTVLLVLQTVVKVPLV